MENADLAQVVLEALQPSTTTQRQANNHSEAHSLRGKIIGVLIRRSRQAAERTAGECAEFLNVEAETIEAWEFGDSVPSLPQLELLAGFLNGGTRQFQAADNAMPTSAQAEYILLRQRLIGAMLRAGRVTIGQSIDELSEETTLDVELLQEYELGETMIPLSHLTGLAQGVNQDLSYFLEPLQDSTGPVPPVSEQKPASEHDAELDQFAADNENADFIRLAMAFRSIGKKNLQRLAEALFAIVEAREASNGRADPQDPAS